MSEAAPSPSERAGVRPNNRIKQITTSTAKPNKLLKRIRKCEQQIDNLKTLPYYTVFNQRAQQEKDIEKAQRKLLKLQSQYSVAVSSSETSWHSDEGRV